MGEVENKEEFQWRKAPEKDEAIYMQDMKVPCQFENETRELKTSHCHRTG